MRDLVIADLRHSLRIWAGSLLVLAVTQLCGMWAVGLLFIGITNLWMLSADFSDTPPLPGSNGTTIPSDVISLIPSAIITASGLSTIIVIVVSSITIRNVVNTIVYQRRRVMALWQLAGMTDRQMLRILRGQIALLSLVALVIAVAAALLSAGWVVDVLRATGLLFTPLMTTDGVFLGYGVGAVVSILVAVFAARGASAELKAISPLEAIRSEGVRELPMTRKRWIGMVIWLAVAVIFAFSTVGTTKLSDADTGSLFVGILGIVVFNIGGPVLIIGLVRAWTWIVPEHASASWFLARATLLSATARTVSTIGSISIAVFLFTALFSKQTAGGSGPDMAAFILVAGFPLAIAVIGSVVLVFMAGQQREREIHLAELAGATPAQQKRQAIFEAVIVVVTGAGVGLLFTIVMLAVYQPALIATTGASAFQISWTHFGGITAVLLVLNVIATVVPTMIAQAARDRIAVPE